METGDIVRHISDGRIGQVVACEPGTMPEIGYFGTTERATVPPEQLENLMQKIPFPRWGEFPDDVRAKHYETCARAGHIMEQLEILGTSVKALGQECADVTESIEKLETVVAKLNRPWWKRMFNLD
jgi:hypothetical protein